MAKCHCVLIHAGPCSVRFFSRKQAVLSAEALDSNGSTDALPHQELTPVASISLGDQIYDAAWYPRAVEPDRASWSVLCSARGSPIQAWDAASGELRSSYRAFDSADEPCSAYSVAFSASGDAVLGGYDSAIRVWDTSRPGRDYLTLATGPRALSRRGGGGKDAVIGSGASQSGLCLCLSTSAWAPDIVAAGSSGGAVALYDARTGQAELQMEGHVQGVTHLKFSVDGGFLYSGGRGSDAAIHCWDLRVTHSCVYSIQRVALGPRRARVPLPQASGWARPGPTLGPATARRASLYPALVQDPSALGSPAPYKVNRKLAFDIEPAGAHLVDGSVSGIVSFYALATGERVATYVVGEDAVGGLSLHPSEPLLATASGGRRFVLSPTEDSSSSDADSAQEDEDESYAECVSDLASEPHRVVMAHSRFSNRARLRLSPDENILRVFALTARHVEATSIEASDAM
ncbi:hypothetical protein H632_c433p0 [Helicosporidium sp. ATCC 50920]|nr:hypothetical protein H632_c433p0 [Helicosporidium sp. ATCC 50920]|eukprot:KDD75926.1 hypothetical protein H632_c433p0 [Helicosporidium sp. ATCC 50920]